MASPAQEETEKHFPPTSEDLKANEQSRQKGLAVELQKKQNESMLEAHNKVKPRELIVSGVQYSISFAYDFDTNGNPWPGISFGVDQRFFSFDRGSKEKVLSYLEKCAEWSETVKKESIDKPIAKEIGVLTDAIFDSKFTFLLKAPFDSTELQASLSVKQQKRNSRYENNVLLPSSAMLPLVKLIDFLPEMDKEAEANLQRTRNR